MGLRLEGNEEIEREVAVRRLGEAEYRPPIVQLTLKSHDVAAELLGLEVVVGGPGARPLGRQVEVHRRLEVVARWHPIECATADAVCEWLRIGGVRNRQVQTLLIDNRVGHDRCALPREVGRIEYGSIASRRSLSAR